MDTKEKKNTKVNRYTTLGNNTKHIYNDNNRSNHYITKIRKYSTYLQRCFSLIFLNPFFLLKVN